MLKVQLKGRFTLSKKYIGKNIHIAFVENNSIKVYVHDDPIKIMPENIKNSKSWINNGLYSFVKTPVKYNSVINILNN